MTKVIIVESVWNLFIFITRVLVYASLVLLFVKVVGVSHSLYLFTLCTSKFYIALLNVMFNVVSCVVGKVKKKVNP